METDKTIVQEKIKRGNFTGSFYAEKDIESCFKLLQNPQKWWTGLYDETITGRSSQLNDEFSFSAGGGAHFSTQKLFALVPLTRIEWLVKESNLTFVNNPKEWNNTKICFDLEKEGNRTLITFTHKGLDPNLDCYSSCSMAWETYLKKLEQLMNNKI